MMTVIISGIFSVVAAVLGALVGKYGWPFLRPVHEHSLAGCATQLRLLSHSGEVQEIDPDHLTIDITGGIIREYKHHATVEIHHKIKQPDGTESLGIIRGKGPLRNGIAYLTYTGSHPDRSYKWNGIACLRLPGIGEFTGYWITEDTFCDSDYALGRFHLTKK